LGIARKPVACARMAFPATGQWGQLFPTGFRWPLIVGYGFRLWLSGQFK
jgi:hypothetical protein